MKLFLNILEGNSKWTRAKKNKYSGSVHRILVDYNLGGNELHGNFEFLQIPMYADLSRWITIISISIWQLRTPAAPLISAYDWSRKTQASSIHCIIIWLLVIPHVVYN